MAGDDRGWVLSRLRAVGWGVPCTKALSKLRDRIGALPVELLFRRSWSHAFGLLVCAWDGTEVSLADNDQVAGRFGVVGVPKVRLLVLLACGSRQLIDAVVGGLGKGEGEVSLAHRLAGSLRAGMLLLADRNFLNYRYEPPAATAERICCGGPGRTSPRLPVHRVLPGGAWLSVLCDPDDLRAWHRNRERGHRPPKPALSREPWCGWSRH